MRKVTKSDYIASINEEFTLRLDENPTTGYSWDITLSPGLQLISDEYHPPSQQIPGAGGYHTWRIRATTLGLQTISGVYRRPWESITGGEKKYHTNIMVTLYY